MILPSSKPSTPNSVPAISSAETMAAGPRPEFSQTYSLRSSTSMGNLRGLSDDLSNRRNAKHHLPNDIPIPNFKRTRRLTPSIYCCGSDLGHYDDGSEGQSHVIGRRKVEKKTQSWFSSPSKPNRKKKMREDANRRGLKAANKHEMPEVEFSNWSAISAKKVEQDACDWSGEDYCLHPEMTPYTLKTHLPTEGSEMTLISLGSQAIFATPNAASYRASLGRTPSPVSTSTSISTPSGHKIDRDSSQRANQGGKYCARNNTNAFGDFLDSPGSMFNDKAKVKGSKAEIGRVRPLQSAKAMAELTSTPSEGCRPTSSFGLIEGTGAQVSAYKDDAPFDWHWRKQERKRRRGGGIINCSSSTDFSYLNPDKTEMELPTNVGDAQGHLAEPSMTRASSEPSYTAVMLTNTSYLLPLRTVPAASLRSRKTSSSSISVYSCRSPLERQQETASAEEDQPKDRFRKQGKMEMMSSVSAELFGRHHSSSTTSVNSKKSMSLIKTPSVLTSSYDGSASNQSPHISDVLAHFPSLTALPSKFIPREGSSVHERGSPRGEGEYVKEMDDESYPSEPTGEDEATKSLIRAGRINTFGVMVHQDEFSNEQNSDVMAQRRNRLRRKAAVMGGFSQLIGGIVNEFEVGGDSAKDAETSWEAQLLDQLSASSESDADGLQDLFQSDGDFSLSHDDQYHQQADVKLHTRSRQHSVSSCSRSVTKSSQSLRNTRGAFSCTDEQATHPKRQRNGSVSSNHTCSDPLSPPPNVPLPPVPLAPGSSSRRATAGDALIAGAYSDKDLLPQSRGRARQTAPAGPIQKRECRSKNRSRQSECARVTSQNHGKKREKSLTRSSHGSREMLHQMLSEARRYDDEAAVFMAM